MGKYVTDLISKLDLSKDVIIQTHNYPDPDSIAAAFGLSYLLKCKGIESKIYHFGDSERYTTTKLIDALNIEMKDLNGVEVEGNGYNVILVDTQKNNSNTQGLSGKEIACIDHHPDNGVQYLYKDVRSEVGACSSIITQYFLDEEIPIPEEVATALVYGIKMDTLDFNRGTSKFDIEMYKHLHGLENKRIVDDICRDKYLIEDVKTLAYSLSTMKVNGDVGFINVGYNCPEPLIASIADFTLSIVEINFAVTYSEKENIIKLSVRSQLNNLDAGKIIIRALKGIGSGGGHKEMSGGLIEKQKLVDLKIPLEKVIEDRFMKAIEEIRL
ncbi:MAG: bifunctional oligoribonuclease/PAP phosphatase NrnA [Clostridiaceae bacterium]